MQGSSHVASPSATNSLCRPTPVGYRKCLVNASLIHAHFHPHPVFINRKVAREDSRHQKVVCYRWGQVEQYSIPAADLTRLQAHLPCRFHHKDTLFTSAAQCICLISQCCRCSTKPCSGPHDRKNNERGKQRGHYPQLTPSFQVIWSSPFRLFVFCWFID